LRVGPGTEFKVKAKLPAGTELNLDAVSQDGKWKHVGAAIRGEIFNGWIREKFVVDQPCKNSTTGDTAIQPAINPTVTDKPWWEDRTKVDLQYLQWLEKNPNLMPLEMKDADWCRKRDHKDPACIVESEIGKARLMGVGGVLPANRERATECPKWLGVPC
jgi:hypothetical protein